MTRTTLILLTGAAAATLAGCGPRWRHGDYGDNGAPMKVVSTLQCPDHQGSLTRVRVAADGMSCDYAGPRGSEVTLKLVKPTDSDSAAIDALDAEVNGLMPGVLAKVNEAPAQSEDEDEDKHVESGSSHTSREKVDINLPGFHVRTRGDRAEIRMPGISIDADDEDKGHGSSHGTAHVTVGGVVDVRAHNEAAIVRVRGRGHGVRAVYRLADKAPSPAGWRMVGYEARGPAGGPLVVALIKSKDTDEDPLNHDADRLVRSNVGG
jgi:hypothetical protein